MTFRFRLESVLSHRERIEQERAGDHARALADRLNAERVRDELIELRDATRGRLRADHRSMDAETLRATYAHLDYLDRAIASAQERVDACAADVERARVQLVDAAKDRKVLTTLKERRREAFELEAARAAQRELDDLNARAYERAHPLEESTS